jgi:hypothetical protein
MVDRELALARAEVQKGRVHGPFESAKEMLAALHRRARRKKPDKGSNAPPLHQTPTLLPLIPDPK